MALQFIPVLKALSTIVATAGTAAASLEALRKASPHPALEPRIRALEEESARVAQAVASMAQQTQTLALELQQQATRLQARERNLNLVLIVSVVSGILAVAALIVSLR